MAVEATSVRVRDEEDCSLLAQFLRSRLGRSGKEVKQLLDQRSVLVNGRRVWMAKHQLHTGDLVQVAEPNRPAAIQILAEAELWLLVNKPCGLLANGGGESVESRLRQDLEQPGIYAVHRLDRDTSGCLLLARAPAARAPLEALFRKHLCRKEYLVLVAGKVPWQSLRCTEPIAGQRCLSDFSCLGLGSQISLLAARIETGRMHQIRIHLAQLGFPVVGEREYAHGKISSQLLRTAPRQMLHAHKLEFTSPWQEGLIQARAEPPEDFVEWARRGGIDEVGALSRVVIPNRIK